MYSIIICITLIIIIITTIIIIIIIIIIKVKIIIILILFKMDIAIVAASADGVSHLWVVRGDTGTRTGTRTRTSVRTLYLFYFLLSKSARNFTSTFTKRTRILKNYFYQFTWQFFLLKSLRWKGLCFIS